ncbi:sporulation histidine kinase inhibitor Sda [Paenibacillus sp. FSL H7-0331]|uniref:Sporulation histidine kinase inhibitor Sda n=1 Tax=Paenibacillus baimaensis TaxID=2982185 RepID=A0ABT2UM23_9BACL|nr:sporulation histidine kinase inhibitor Sda [Paenibacillus sp. FSL H7-0331]MCU6795694.1 sporulation histidine kinase inhibitor Sda [Paenibacillus sp. WQ 127069]
MISILKKLNNEDLLVYYSMAIELEHHVDKEFIELLERELARRNISIQPRQEDNQK